MITRLGTVVKCACESCACEGARCIDVALVLDDR